MYVGPPGRASTIARGWNVDALEGCRRHVLDRGIEYRWSAAPRRHVKDKESLVPYDCLPAVRGGELSLSREHSEWRGAVADFMKIHPSARR